MTVIAWREGFMSADGRIHDYNDGAITNDNATKIVKNAFGWVGGAAGDWPECLRFQEWIKKGCRGKFKPRGEDFCALLVSPKGILTFIDEAGAKEVLNMEFWAIGSGWQFAVGAMDMSADAETAVLVACKRVTTCGGLVTTIETAHRRVRSATLGK